MIIYFVTFAVSVFFYGVAIRFRNRLLRWIALVLCVTIPAGLAAVRNFNVGIDLSGYGIRLWNLAIHSYSFASFVSDTHDIEFVYLVLNYVVSRFTTDIHWFLFIHESIIVLLAVGVALRFKDKIQSEYILTFFYLYLYIISFNLMRQSIALMFITFAATWIYEKRTKESVLPFTLGCLCHTSSYLAILLYPFRYFIEKYESKKGLLTVVIAIAGFTGFSFYATIMYWLMSVGVYSDHYEHYVGMIGFKTHKIELALIASIFITLIYVLKKNERQEPYYSYTFFLLIIAFILNMYGSIVEIAVRLAHYFMMPLAFLIPLSANFRRAQQKIEYVTIFLLLAHLIYLGIFTGMDRTIPYQSQILGVE